MKTKYPILVFALIFFYTCTFSQTGPGGVGTTATNVLWLKADAGTNTSVNGAAVNSWADQSGNGNNVSQAAANQQPLYASSLINGFPAILFDNVNTTNDKLTGADSPALDNTSGYSFFTVSRPQNLDGNARVIVSKRTTVSVDQSFMMFYYTGNKIHTDIQSTNDRFASNTVYTNNSNNLVNLVYDGSLASGSRCKLYNGETLDITASESNSSVPDNASPLVIGSTDATDPRPFGGYISEIIIYRTALTNAPRIIVNNYLSAKYNIPLASNDKYAGDNAANGNYDREVAGIGQESTGANTSFSASVSGGLTIVAMSGLDNGDYLLAGHSTSVNTQITNDVGGMTGMMNARWQRVWYVDVTNTSTNLSTDIEFDLSDGGLSGLPGVASNYVLLYRAGQTGNWTEVAIASSTPGDRIKFNNYIFTNDGYYTVGTKNYDASPLPVTLVDFDAVKLEKKVKVSWKTESEKNIKVFSVEKSVNGKDFVEIWNTPAKGNGKYVAFDENPFEGIAYYRLKIEDLDTEVSYSDIRTVDYLSDEFSFEVFPNPSNNGTFTVKLSKPTEVVISLYDVAGKLCYSNVLTTQAREIFNQPENNLSAGIYILKLTAGNTTYYKKLVISFTN